MARLILSGYELNSATLDCFVTLGNTAPTIVASPVRSGSFAASHAVSSTFQSAFKYANSGGLSVVYARIYVYLTSNPPSNATDVLAFYSSSPELAYLQITTSGAVQLWDGKNNVQIGSNSAALSLNQWCCLELGVDATTPTSSTLTGRIDGTQFANGTANLGAGINIQEADWGFSLSSSGTWTMYTDDIAINDNTGSFQNSWPGSEKIIHLRANAIGDAAAWTKTGTSPAASNWQGVNEVTPDDGTTINTSLTLNQEDLFNFDNSGIGVSDVVNVVAIGVRYRGEFSSSVSAFKLEVEKTASGTKTQSAEITPNSTSYKTNANAVPTNYPLVTYQDPDGAAWTQTTLDSLQAGYILSSASTFKADISTIWVSVGYTPAATTPTYFDHNTVSQPYPQPFDSNPYTMLPLIFNRYNTPGVVKTLADRSAPQPIIAANIRTFD